MISFELHTSYAMRQTIAWDALAQTACRYGVPGVTISSRTGTAADHGHKWGEMGERALNAAYIDIRWNGQTKRLFFGPDLVTGESHCTGAMKNDVIRAVGTIKEILCDDVVLLQRGLYGFRAEVLAELQRLLAPPSLTLAKP